MRTIGPLIGGITGYLMVILNGLTMAGYLFIMAIGLNMSFGLMRICNMNHGTFYLLGGFIGWSVVKATGVWWLGLGAAALAVGLIAFLEEFLLLRRARGKTTMETLITLSLSIIGTDLIIAIWTGKTRQIDIPDFAKGIFKVGKYFFPKFNVFIIVFAAVIGLVFWLIYRKTKVGMILRAGVDNFEIVATCGINVKRLFTAVFAVSGALAGMAGVIGGTYQMLVSGQDGTVMVYTLLVVIIGGIGSFGGAILGSIIIGLIYTVGTMLAPQFSYFFLFAPVALVLAFRPQGFFGKVGRIND